MFINEGNPRSFPSYADGGAVLNNMNLARQIGTKLEPLLNSRGYTGPLLSDLQVPEKARKFLSLSLLLLLLLLLLNSRAHCAELSPLRRSQTHSSSQKEIAALWLGSPGFQDDNAAFHFSLLLQPRVK